MEPYGEPDLVDISGNTVTAEMQFSANYDAHLSYEDAASGIYDKEEGRRIFMDFVRRNDIGPRTSCRYGECDLRGTRTRQVHNQGHCSY